MKPLWIISYLIAYGSFLVMRHFFGFEIAVLSGVAWAIADLNVTRS